MSTQPRRTANFGVMLAVAATGFISCSDSNDSGGGGTGATVTITAPGIVGPNGGTPANNPPTLTVTNVTVTNGSAPTYTFQVATDQAFSDLLRQVTGIAQGSGQTSWTPDTVFGNGTFFWRARAVAGGVSGPFSAVAQFTVGAGGGGAAGGGAGETVVVFDPLTNGMSLGQVFGGGFTGQGWRINTNSDFIRYNVPTITDGFVEWENLGLTRRGANDNAFMLFGMWDPDAGGFRQNPFRVNVQKLWNNPHFPPFFRVRWISQGRQEDAGTNRQSWDPGTVYTFRVDWGPAAGANTARVFVDGEEEVQVRYNRTYAPSTHFIELGIGERGESVIDAIYRNVSIVRRD